MQVAKLLSWHEDVAAKVALLAKAKVAVDAAPLVRTSALVGEMARLNPAVLVLDMDKLPSHARQIALMLRASKSARHIPILLAGNLPATGGGVPDKFARLRAELPDLPYAEWSGAAKAVAKLLKQPPTAPPIVPPERVYTASLAEKLGVAVRPGSKAVANTSPKTRQIALIAAPESFVELLGDLPETVTFVSLITAKTALAICFIRTLEQLAGTLDMLTLRLPENASVWIAYPRRAAHPHLDFNENDVRDAGLAVGLVDYKVCSIDTKWSGIKFAWRK